MSASNTTGSKVKYEVLLASIEHFTSSLSKFRKWVEDQIVHIPVMVRAKTQLIQFCTQCSNNIEKMMHQLMKIETNIYVSHGKYAQIEQLESEVFKNVREAIECFCLVVGFDQSIVREITPKTLQQERQNLDLLTAISCFQANLVKMSNFLSMLKTNPLLQREGVPDNVKVLRRSLSSINLGGISTPPRPNDFCFASDNPLKALEAMTDKSYDGDCSDSNSIRRNHSISSD